MTVPFRVKALYEYSSPHDDDLNFDAGQVITVNEEEDDDWYGGEYIDGNGVKKEGIFPRNFVEKFEPTAPPRPTRSRPKKESEALPSEEVAAPAPPPPAPVEEQEQEREPETTEEPEPEPSAADRPVPIVPGPVATKPAAPAFAKSPPAAPKQPEASASKSKPAPPPVSEKPNSFKDRIAAFNKSAAPPIAPFKPSGLGAGGGSTGFVKKPFVPPPPSRNAYVPPPREKPTTNIYRREEDPEIKEREAEAFGQAEKAGLVPGEQRQEEGDDDQPKPTSLKERIALLQKQQLEQAQRHADAATKKDKPKKPLKKKTEASAPGDGDEEAEEGPLSPSLERVETLESETRTSMDDTHARAPPPRRRPSKGPAANESHDGNEADMSGAGDTTEGQDDTTEREDNEEALRHVSRVPTTSTTATAGPHREVEEENEEPEGEGQEEEEEEDVDPEVRRKEELRARMAKMSGGMGFHGMFGAPPPPMAKKKASKPVETSGADEAVQESIPRAAPPVPTPMVLPGMGSALAPSRSHQEEEDEDEDADGDEATPVPTRTMPPPLPSRAAEHKEDADDEGEDEATTPAPVTETTCMYMDYHGCHGIYELIILQRLVEILVAPHLFPVADQSLPLCLQSVSVDGFVFRLFPKC